MEFRDDAGSVGKRAPRAFHQVVTGRKRRSWPNRIPALGGRDLGIFLFIHDVSNGCIHGSHGHITGEDDAKTKKIPFDLSDPSKTTVIGDRKYAIKEELTKLLAAGFIKEVLHPDWLANPVLVWKKTGQCRMCVDYTDLNKSCPKDPFGLPRIDQVVDSTAGCELLSFLDCYSGYHQINLKEFDCLKTSFITPFGAYFYITMPFGLKNDGATYQRMIQRCFSTQIGRNVEAYVDDVVVKTKQKDDIIADLEETFASIRAFRMKLNPEKCTFGVPSGKLLGFMVSRRGIQANPEKINAILNMKPPSS
uniref:Retrotransposon protein, putative, Ty3-gypsy subclass n=1 Tax=Oryza sativa subsp. japonica TaxID=39947 RepID=Q33A69_ORYSJ|nr:retrotransposon protein, putative, Ty3-gypsy subclass [Oryza sativa Japonica Group]